MNMWIGRIAVLLGWLAGFGFFLYIEFALVYIIISALYFIFYNTSNRTDGPSAYSVFNKGIMRLKGTFTTDAMETMVTGKPFEQRQPNQRPNEIGLLPAGRHITAEPFSTKHYLASGPFTSQYRKIGRNERCHCGSGKKYKHCCEKLTMSRYSDSSDSDSD